MSETRIETPLLPEASDWPIRPWLLAGLLGLAGLLIHFVTDGHSESPGWMALAAFLFFGSMAAAFSLDRSRWQESTIFALIGGLVMAGLTWRAVGVGDHSADEQYGFYAGVIATMLALPLFQAGFHKTRFKTAYRDTHFFVWTDVVSVAGALAFTGLTWLLLLALAMLFGLLNISLLKDLMEEGWFGWTLSGAAFGAALGVLRNHLKILGTLQSVVLMVLSLLAVPMAFALILFLAAMLFSGIDVLWEATRSATPVLLSCAAGAFVLANAILRDDDAEMSGNRLMRIAALVLALGVMPLSLLAAISMGTRIGQYGLSPERLWAMIAILVACVYGLAYLVTLVRRRFRGWGDALRRANLYLAVGVCLFALFLALPVLDFGAISTKNQIARLTSGAVSADDFDYDALRWDFGDSGREALDALAKSENAEIADAGEEALEQESRWWSGRRNVNWADKLANLRVESDDPAVQKAVEDWAKSTTWHCTSACVVVELGVDSKGRHMLAIAEQRNVQFLELTKDGEIVVNNGAAYEVGLSSVELTAESQVEIRPYSGRQIYVDGKPVGLPFE